MKLVFVSNYLNHHQLELCEQFRENFSDFVFVATDMQAIQGYQLLINTDYVVDYQQNKELTSAIIREYDVVIFGSAVQELVDLRMQTKKLTFLYSERFYKRGTWRRFNPSTLKKLYNRIIKYKEYPFYVLCASAYLTYDLKLLTYPTEKCYRWGYFPEFIEHNVEQLLDNKEQTHILWCSRFLRLKHPEHVLYAIKKLKDENIKFHLTMIGDGEMKAEIEKMVDNYGLCNEVSCVGSMTQSQVRRYMEKCGIFVFSSDFGEGWGAVMNEAMNSGCAMIASHAAGSVPFLINEGINGYIYKSGDVLDLYKKLKTVLINSNLQRMMGMEAYKTIANEWNSKVAALRLRSLSEAIQKKDDALNIFENGPCSPARLLKNNWYKIRRGMR